MVAEQPANLVGGVVVVYVEVVRPPARTVGPTDGAPSLLALVHLGVVPGQEAKRFTSGLLDLSWAVSLICGSFAFLTPRLSPIPSGAATTELYDGEGRLTLATALLAFSGKLLAFCYSKCRRSRHLVYQTSATEVKRA